MAEIYWTRSISQPCTGLLHVIGYAGRPFTIDWGDGTPVQDNTPGGDSASYPHTYPVSTGVTYRRATIIFTDTEETTTHDLPACGQWDGTADWQVTAPLTVTYTWEGVEQDVTVVWWDSGLPPVNQTYQATGTGVVSAQHTFADGDPASTRYIIDRQWHDDVTVDPSGTVAQPCGPLYLTRDVDAPCSTILHLMGQDGAAVTIDWGDGSPQQAVTLSGDHAEVPHDYPADGTGLGLPVRYTVRVVNDSTGQVFQQRVRACGSWRGSLSWTAEQDYRVVYRFAGVQERVVIRRWSDDQPLQDVAYLGGPLVTVAHDFPDATPVTTSFVIDCDWHGRVTVDPSGPALGPCGDVLLTRSIAQPCRVMLHLYGHDGEQAVITWGDGTGQQTVTVDSDRYRLEHDYPAPAPGTTTPVPRTVTIVLPGETIERTIDTCGQWSGAVSWRPVVGHRALIMWRGVQDNVVVYRWAEDEPETETVLEPANQVVTHIHTYRTRQLHDTLFVVDCAWHGQIQIEPGVSLADVPDDGTPCCVGIRHPRTLYP